MGSNINFKNYGDVQNGDVNGGRLAGNLSLARQSSVYSLTFDEFQNTMGGLGKDFGSMNMDELLKNIWSAEETQGIASTPGAGEGNAPVGNLQRQGSLTLPRTLSQKTVDDVWKELIRESGDAKFGNFGAGSNLPQEQRQQTFGEMTLEEFLAKAGVVREDAQEMARPGNSGFFGELFCQSNNTGVAPGYQQASRNNGLMGSRVESNNNTVANQSPKLGLNVGGVRTSQQQTHQLPQQQQQPIFPKPATLSFALSMHSVNNAQLTSPRSRGPMSAVVEPSRNTAFSQGGGFPGAGIGMGGLGAGGVTVASRSPVNQILPDVIAKSSADTSSLSPVPYMFTRGRKANGALEKVVERRQRRMIKNRESAARSRARKQLLHSHVMWGEVTCQEIIRKECRSDEFPIEEEDDQFPSYLDMEDENLELLSQSQRQQRAEANAWRTTIADAMWDDMPMNDDDENEDDNNDDQDNENNEE